MYAKNFVGVAAFAAGSVTTALAGLAHGQWTVTNLSPAGATESYGKAAGGAQQAGYVFADGMTRASVWNRTASSWVDLSPIGSTDSFGLGSNGSQQVGYARVADVGRASLWSGTAASWVDLHPAGSVGSLAYAISDSQQAGYANVG
ncbi:MAG: hypothetical protein ACOYN0_19100, partial [Phycisphaerales bacterium]